MHDDEDPETGAHAEEEEPRFVPGVVRIIRDGRVVVVERRLGFGEADPVLADVGSRLPGIPLEADRLHSVMYVRRTYVASPVRDSPTPTLRCERFPIIRPRSGAIS